LTNVVLVSSKTGIGGGETSLLNLARGFRDNHVDYTMLVKGGRYYELLRDRAEPVRPLTCLTLLKEILFHHQKNFLINDFESLVHYGALLKLTRRRVLWMAHGWWYTGIKLLFVFAFADRVIAVSTAIQRHFVACRSLSERVRLIPLGIPILQPDDSCH
jgi:hypothetical protein